MKNLYVDCGMDELSDGTFQIAIGDAQSNVVANVFGKTPEEAAMRADQLVNGINAMQKREVKEERKIRVITEAFSMQPQTLYVGQIIQNAILSGESGDAPFISKWESLRLDRIEEKEEMWEEFKNNKVKFVVGYSEEGHQLFKYRAACVNIEYYHS